MTDVAPETPAEAPKSSLLSRLRAQRAEMDANQYTDIDVPRWTDPPLKVRYGVLEHPYIRAQYAKINKAPKGQRGQMEVDANADLLIKACLGVYAVEDGKEKSLHPDGEDMEWTRFDPALGEALGLPEAASAREVLRRVYFADGDVISTATEVVQFSGYKNTDNNDAFLGE